MSSRPRFIDPRTEPASVRVLLKTGEGVRIEWKDGHHSDYAFDYLRNHCPCATCSGGHGGQPKIISDLPLYKEKARAVGAEAVGNYALRFDFSDGHNTGIYSFNHLRAVCPCPDCTTAHKSPAP